jgi:hypothetical protein
MVERVRFSKGNDKQCIRSIQKRAQSYPCDVSERTEKTRPKPTPSVIQFNEQAG